ncbi:MAG: aminoacetone oxidase family FAD-binding enzyme [Campylobacterales bacterium]|nr:aminoacetone oxidase family FAD-binding enzyme [Campylobacterales bacterium]
MKIYDNLIIGAGASGLMVASRLDAKFTTAIVDVNQKMAKKLRISGGGKCNYTNVDVSANNYDGDAEMVEFALTCFSKDELLEWLESNGVSREIRKDRYYFCKNSADEIIELLKDGLKDADKYLGEEVLDVKKEGEVFVVKTTNTTLRGKKLIVASGGKSYSSIGGSDVGLKIAKSFGIAVKEFTPALMGLTLQKEQFWMKELSGLSCYVHISVGYKVLKEEMLFAHKGISGPAVLSASLYWQKGDMSIDFLPNEDIEKLVKNSNKNISSVIPLPKRLSKALLDALGVKDIECKKIDDKTLTKLKNIHSYTFAPAGNFGFTKAEVSRGGVLSDELNHYTLESLKVPNLYFIGEVVDVTGELGGYNFQWAFSSAVVCANGVNF